ncbi:MAG: isocitrate lyase/PEP mutase family protein [SAR324 cluster bacterium]|nr:isocitrate lyase/PEP mutase family protein [SAR324 cluster bacterium]
MTDHAKKLRELLARPKMLVAPGCYDALSAKLIQQEGFEAAYMTGFGTSASVLGMPDAGLISFSEMATHAGNIANAIDIPLIADGDTGYGNAVNVYRTVKAYARAGVAGLHIEDQVFPKKCGHVAGKKVVPSEEMVGKIRAAVDARAEKDILIIARTDARVIEGVEPALRRCQAYLEAGADMIFFEAPESEGELETIGKKINAPLLINMAIGGKTPFVPLSRLEGMGFNLAIFPATIMKSAIVGMRQALQRIKEHPDENPATDEMSFEDIKTLVGFPEYYEMEAKYGS